jgi:hypothetical protein
VTPLALLLQLSGLSQREAAELLGVSPASIDKMARGTRPTPAGVLRDLQALVAMQQRAAGEALERIEAAGDAVVEIGYPADDHEAQALGWPCIGAWRGMAARVIAAVPDPGRIAIFPRGSTPATAAAADRHGR